MTLKETGARLVVEGDSTFINKMGRATGAVNAFERGTRGASIGSIAFGTAFGNILSGGLRATVDLLGRGSRAMVGFFGDSLSLATDLEAQMSGVGAVMGATNEELEMLNNLVVDLGIDPNLKVSSLEAAQAIEMLGRNGLSVQEVLDGAARATVLLSNATGSDMSLAANVATDAMALFNIEAGNMEQVVNGATAVVNNSKFDLNDYSLALRNGGAAAADMNVSLLDFNTAVIASAEELGSGMRAGTGFRNFMTRLTPSTKTATEAMKELGFITEDGTNIFFDANGQLKDMNEVAQILRGGLSTLSDAQRSNALETIFGADAQGTALAIAKEGEVIYTDVAKAAEELGVSQDILNNFVEDGITSWEALQAQYLSTDAEAAAAMRVDNLWGALEILDGVIESIKLKIAEPFLDLIQGQVENLSGFIEENSDTIVGFFENVAEKVGLFIGAFSSSLSEGESPLDSFFGALNAAGISDETIGRVSSFLDTITAIGNFIVTWGPTVISVVSTLGVVFGTWTILSTISGFVSSLVFGWGTLMAAISASGSVLGGIVMLLGGPVTLAIAGVVALVGGLYYAWQNNLWGIRDTAAEIWPQVQGFFSSAMAAISGVVGAATARLSQWWADHGASVKTIVNTFLGFVSNIFGTKLAETQGKVTEVLGALSAFWDAWGGTIIDITSMVWGNVKTQFDLGLELVGEALDAIAAALTGDWEAFGEAMDNISGLIWDSVASTFRTKQSVMATVTAAIRDQVSGTWLDFSWASLGDAVIDGIAGAISSGAKRLASAAASVALGAYEAAKGALKSYSPSRLFMYLGDMVIAGFVKTINGGKDTVMDSVKRVFSFADAFSGIGNTAANFLKKDVIDPLDKEIKDLQDAEKRYSKSLAEFYNLDVDRISQSGLRGVAFHSADPDGYQSRTARTILSLQRAIAEKSQDRVAAERKILDLQEKQQRLGFLKQQLDLVKLIQDNNLGGSGILGGLQLGSNADPSDIVEASARAIEAIINRTTAAFSPPATAQQINSNTDNSVNVTIPGATFANQPPQLVASQIEYVLAGSP